MKTPSDYNRSAGGAALGARLRRLSERIDRDIARVYSAKNVMFEQRWFGVINQIVLNERMAVGDIAAALGITHVSVIESSRSLERAGYVTSVADEADGRRRLLMLTAAGKRLVVELTPLWRSFDRAAEDLNTEVGAVTDLLDRLDDALDAQSLFDRIVGQDPDEPA